MNKSYLYNFSVGDFYEVGLKSTSISDASQKLKTTEGNLKWFLYYVNENNNSDEKREERLERVRAFFDGQNERKKRKLDLDI